MAIYDLNPEYYDSYRTNIRNVSEDAVLKAARTHLHPELLQTVIVGDAATVRDSLTDNSLGEVTVHDA
jgi:predicted Zn-dependent peptidase